jgi:ATP-dependent HslUV protease ATP-binding subunit HslU
MNPPIEEYTPREIVAELDKYIIGQDAAKRAVAIALRNRFRRQQLPLEERDDVLPKNILMMGPTGVGKTEIARRLAQLARAPFVKVEATKFTEVGYVGRDVDAMVRDLVANSVRLVERERAEAVEDRAKELALDRMAELLEAQTGDSTPAARVAFPMFGGMPIISDASGEDDGEETDGFQAYDWQTEENQRQERVATIREELAQGERQNELVEIEIEESNNPFLQVFTPGGMEEMGLDMNQLPGNFGSKRSSFKATVAEAMPVLIEEEAKKCIDQGSVNREALKRAEQTGIIFIDEIDKVAVSQTKGAGPDVSREGVQRDLLPIIEGSTVQSKFGPIRTDHILFIAAGAFHMSSPSDLIPELQGRLPIRVELDPLTEEDFGRILKEPKNALTKQYVKLLAVDGYQLSFTPEALDAIAHFASEINKKIENIGARRLHTVMEKLLEDHLFEAPENGPKTVSIDAETVYLKLEKFTNHLASARKIL